MFRFCLCCLFVSLARGKVLDIHDFGAVPGHGNTDRNRDALNQAFKEAESGDVVYVSGGKTYVMSGGVVISNKHSISFQVDGVIQARDCTGHFEQWPSYNFSKDRGLNKVPFIHVRNSRHVALRGGGMIDGNGVAWWNAFVLGEFKGERPILLLTENSTDLVYEHVRFLNSPRFFLMFRACARVTVRHISIDVDRNRQREIKAVAIDRRLRDYGLGHLNRAVLAQALSGQSSGPIDWVFNEIVKLLPKWILQPEDLNTDGIDTQGRDFHIYNCTINNDDDSVAVKPSTRKDLYETRVTECTENVLIENMTMTGFGASIGSVPPHADVNCIRNVTFRDIKMPGTGKGVYIKSNPSCGFDKNIDGETVPKTATISDVLYEDVRIEKPWWWAIWIGPQQQHEPNSALGEKCSLTYPHGDCPTQGCATFKDITLRNVRITDPLISPGVIFGNETNRMQNITLDGVVVEYSSNPLHAKWPFGPHYMCVHADVNVVGGTRPTPSGHGCSTHGLDAFSAGGMQTFV